MDSCKRFLIGNPEVYWDNGDNPHSGRKADVYFATNNGLSESNHVFIKGIRAPEIWQYKSKFVIGEAGFGTGLNFLNTWNNWRNSASLGSRLYYVAIEGYPLTSEEIMRAINPYPSLIPLSQQLVKKIPQVHHGFQTIRLDHDRVFLTLLYGPIESMLTGLVADIDAWYLDGFAPNKNPEMWTIKVINEIARLSHFGTRVATFTASGQVRRQLTLAGFEMEKVLGYGFKRECLRGEFKGGDAESHLAPFYKLQRPLKNSARIAVIGGGIAGCAVANTLHANGASVILYERNKSAATEASGNPIALVQPKIADPKNSFARFQVDAYLHAVKKFQEFGLDSATFNGLISLARNDEAFLRHLKWIKQGVLPDNYALELDQSTISDAAGLSLSGRGILFSQAMGIQPSLLCNLLIDDIDCRYNLDITELRQTPSEWIIYSGSRVEEGRADAVILANSISSSKLNSWCRLSLNAKRGEVSFVEPTSNSFALKRPISYGGYITPIIDKNNIGVHMMGATYDLETDLSKLSWEELRYNGGVRNRATLSQRSMSLSKNFSNTILGGRGSLRATTADHVPVIGPLFSDEEFNRAYRGLRIGKVLSSYVSAEGLRGPQGLYIFNAFGSHGFSIANFASEILVSQILGLPIPADKRVIEYMHPARFIVRNLKKGSDLNY